LHFVTIGYERGYGWPDNKNRPTEIET
jgi:hypothetical protein